MAGWRTPAANPGAPLNLTQLQLSFSTAEIESAVFFGESEQAVGTPEVSPGFAPVEEAAAAPPSVYVLVAGELYPIDEEGLVPAPAIPLAADSPLVRLFVQS